VTLGETLAARRGERGLTIEQAAAATRIRAHYLSALESNELERLAAPVYAKGHLRTYALFLGLDPEPLVAMLNPSPRDARRLLSIEMSSPDLAWSSPRRRSPQRGLSCWPEHSADTHGARSRRIRGRRSFTELPGGGCPAWSAGPDSLTPGRPIVVGVRVTDEVWINVFVDGRPAYADGGKTLPAGSLVYFSGLDIKITSEKAASTFITVDGRAVGALGTGVATRDFASQT